MQGTSVELTKNLLEKSHRNNILKFRIENEQLHTRNARWIKLSQEQVPEFSCLNWIILKN